MHREELLDRVNRWASRHGASPLTERRLRDLVDERIVPGPSRLPQTGQRTPIWRWDHISYRRAQQACWFKAQGAKSFAEIRVLLWMRGRSAFAEPVRADLLRAFKPIRNEILRASGTDSGPVVDKASAMKRIATLARRLGQPSPLLHPPGFEFPSEQLVGAYDAMRFDAESDQLSALVSTFANSLGLPESAANQIILHMPDFVSGMFSGLIGDPTEVTNSAEGTISETIADSFIRAREMTRTELRMLRRCHPVFSKSSGDKSKSWSGPFAATASAVAHPRWYILEFARWLHWAHSATAKERTFLADMNRDVAFAHSVKGEDLAKAIDTLRLADDR